MKPTAKEKEKYAKEYEINCTKRIEVNEVFPFVSDFIYNRKSKKIHKEINGWNFHVTENDDVIGSDFGFGSIAKISSQRLTLFKSNSTCVCCGVKDSYFKKKQAVVNGVISYHLNLYAEYNGKSILMTKDHIVPKSQGGKNIMENYVTTCEDCNKYKSNISLSWSEIRNKLQHGIEINGANKGYLNNIKERIGNVYETV